MSSQKETGKERFESGDTPSHLSSVTPEMDRRNGRIFCLYYLLAYLASPAGYVGVLQAALCDRLGTSATVANLPAAANFLGAFSPLFLSSVIPYRSERTAIVVASYVTAASLAGVCTALFFPFGRTVRVAAVIGQALISGFSAFVSYVYTYQCLGRGTTLQGRARALKLTFTLGPIAAVVAAVGTQFVLKGGIPALRFPYDFGVIYLLGIPCMVGVALLSSRFELVGVKEEQRPPLFRYIGESLRSYARDRSSVLLWFAFLLWNFAVNAMPNLSLYTREAIGRAPQEFSGLIMALRFGFKSLGGFVLGAIAIRRGIRAPVSGTVLLMVAAILWAWIVPGYPYLLAFGLMGAGELGGVYFANYAIVVSSAATGARNLALLNLAGPVSGLAPVIHGALTDLFGFRASFAFGLVTALLPLWLVSKLPSGPSKRDDVNPG